MIALCPGNFTQIKQVLDYLAKMLGVHYTIKESVHKELVEGRTGIGTTAPGASPVQSAPTVTPSATPTSSPTPLPTATIPACQGPEGYTEVPPGATAMLSVEGDDALEVSWDGHSLAILQVKNGHVEYVDDVPEGHATLMIGLVDAQGNLLGANQVEFYFCLGGSMYFKAPPRGEQSA